MHSHDAQTLAHNGGLPDLPRKTSPLPDVLQRSFTDKLFPSHLELVPQLNEFYELELATAEASLMSEEELIANSAYFARVGNQLTRHFLICSGEPLRLPKHSSSQLRSFFENNQFRTGYATHGLFPYRGKFHPQMIKGLLNVMGLKPGQTVVDPMMGSGTVLIEASLMGIKSIGIDASPFCRFMVQAKLDGLTVPLQPLKMVLGKSKKVFDHFKSRAGQPKQGSKVRYVSRQTQDPNILEDKQWVLAYDETFGALPQDCQSPKVYAFLLLAYLDSAGYSERSERKTPYDQFHSILERYYFVAKKIQEVLEGYESVLADSAALEGDARKLPIRDDSVDGILFSPPYSFAIDYVENDSFHLNYMGTDLEELRCKMIGLRGKTLQQKYEHYREDMNAVMGECSRVLKLGGFCTVVVGTNSNQLSKILRRNPGEVTGLEELISEWSAAHGLNEIRRLSRQIRGMSNTMRTEYILFLQKQRG